MGNAVHKDCSCQIKCLKPDEITDAPREYTPALNVPDGGLYPVTFPRPYRHGSLSSRRSSCNIWFPAHCVFLVYLLDGSTSFCSNSSVGFHNVECLFKVY